MLHMSPVWMVFIVLFVVARTSRWRAGRRGYGRGYLSRWGAWNGDEAFGESKRIDELMTTVEQRNQDVELLQTRVTELENRLDFAERLLAERRNLEITSG
jgi:hypothetical protein